MEPSTSSTNGLSEEEYKYGVKSTEYVDLLPFEREGHFTEYFEEAMRFSSSDDWKENFFAIDTLRRLNKFSPETLEARIMEALPFIDY
mmetsp:Transcript_10260/g.11514  ORF Transcript_10260/g.11514 Transcript_10260/m.11514 type:complete len:88 (-) Transcript_10260:664-927(-)